MKYDKKIAFRISEQDAEIIDEFKNEHNIKRDADILREALFYYMLYIKHGNPRVLIKKEDLSTYLTEIFKQ